MRLNEGLYDELEKKSAAIGLDKADFIRILIRKFDVKLDTDKLRSIDVVGLTEVEKGKRYKQADKLRYEEALWEYKLKYGSQVGGIMVDHKKINEIYVKNKLREEIEALGGKQYLSNILKGSE